MLLEHTMAVNFSYKGHSKFDSKWPPEYTCLNISVSKSLGKMIFVSKYTFLGPSITKKDNNKYVNLNFNLIGRPPENTYFNIAVSN